MTIGSDASLPIYQQRVRKALTFLEQNLSPVPSLAQIAAAAGFSPWHFHRIFSAFTGESVGACVKRLRLEKAAARLINTTDRVLDVALDAGFESESSFAKAFKAHFSQPPGSFRKSAKHKPTSDNPTTMTTAEIQPVEVSRFEPIEVYFVRKTGPYGESAGAAFGALMPFVYGNRLITPASRCFGISWDDPSITQPDKVRYDAATTVEIEHPLSGEVERKSIEGGRYAVFLHKGPYENLFKTYDSIYSKWLPESGETLRDLPPVEEYLNRDPRRTKPENLRTHIRIPLN